MGITDIHKVNDDLFFAVNLPDGWKLEKTDHDMWNTLRDDKGRTRAMIFYKAAFYDRSSHIDFQTRYQVRAIYLGEGFEEGKYLAVMDEETEIFRTEPTKDYDTADNYRSDCYKYLNENFPDWQDINAYW